MFSWLNDLLIWYTERRIEYLEETRTQNSKQYYATGNGFYWNQNAWIDSELSRLNERLAKLTSG